MADAKDATIRRYQDGDERPITALFEEVFGEPKPVDRWRWQYRDHPRGASWITVAERDGRLVGHNGLMREHVNFNGREVVAGQESDAMITEAARGGGLYSRLGIAGHAQAAESGARALFSFPSRNSSPGSYPLLIRRLGHRRIANLRHFSRRVGVRSILGAAGGRVAKLVTTPVADVRLAVTFARGYGGLTVDVSHAIPADCDEALKQIHDYEVLAIWKDRPYLQWRYERSPSRQYLVFALRRDGVTHGLVVGRVRGDTLALCEVLHRRKDVRETAYLLQRVVRHARRLPVDRVEFHGFDNGFFEAAFDRAGFTREAFSRYIFIGKVMGDPELEQYFYHAPNWSISWGDGDEL